jgi:hypothetical protein
VLNNGSAIEDIVIKERIAAGNNVLYASKMIMFSKLQTRNSKICIYKLLTRPVVTCKCETEMGTKRHTRTIIKRVLEIKAMRKMYCPIICRSELRG